MIESRQNLPLGAKARHDIVGIETPAQYFECDALIEFAVIAMREVHRRESAARQALVDAPVIEAFAGKIFCGWRLVAHDIGPESIAHAGVTCIKIIGYSQRCVDQFTHFVSQLIVGTFVVDKCVALGSGPTRAPPSRSGR